MSPIESNLQHVAEAIHTAIGGLPQDRQQPVTLIAVSKTQSANAVRAAFEAGQRAFGENYVQEASTKIAELADLRARGIEWHLIGPLQSNKARLAAESFDWVHSIDRLKIADALGRHRTGLSALNVCLQVNISGEASKSGLLPETTLNLAREVASIPNLKLRGLMAIIENTPSELIRRAQFAQMRQLVETTRNAGIPVDTLSMGMSGDFSMAIAEGATMVRVGTAIFGLRGRDH